MRGSKRKGLTNGTSKSPSPSPVVDHEKQKSKLKQDIKDSYIVVENIPEPVEKYSGPVAPLVIGKQPLKPNADKDIDSSDEDASEDGDFYHFQG